MAARVKMFLSLDRWWLYATGCVALGILGTFGIVSADISSDNRVFHSCVKDSELRLIDTTERATCDDEETAVTWNQIAPQGPADPTGPQGLAGSTIFLNRNFQDLPLGAFPGVTVAHLDLGPGTYLIEAKFRYRNNGAGRQTASCAYQGIGIGGLDSSQQNLDPGGEFTGQIDGVLLDFVTKHSDDVTDVHVQCFGPSDGSVHIINTQFTALLAVSFVLQK
jgi:hypothetical protein